MKISTPVENPSPAMLKAFEGPSVEDDFVVRPWGKVLTGYAPIKNAMGVVVGVVAVDMDAAVVEKRMDFVGQT
ncbi:MAG TPA: HAMP domain-containing protein, partial [Methanospirillum sp.]|nr:HAMP domain-containing protein [Methanospirillum sp.]